MQEIQFKCLPKNEAILMNCEKIFLSGTATPVSLQVYISNKIKKYPIAIIYTLLKFNELDFKGSKNMQPDIRKNRTDIIFDCCYYICCRETQNHH